jgi:hypothetical protein
MFYGLWCQLLWLWTRWTKYSIDLSNVSCEKETIYVSPSSLGLTIITKLTSHIMVLLIVVKLTFQIQKPWMLGLVQSWFWICPFRCGVHLLSQWFTCRKRCDPHLSPFKLKENDQKLCCRFFFILLHPWILFSYIIFAISIVFGNCLLGCLPCPFISCIMLTN